MHHWQKVLFALCYLQPKFVFIVKIMFVA